MDTTKGSAPVLLALRRELHRLARVEEDRAANEAATVPYWAPCPASVEGHRMAAAALRADADALLARLAPAQ
jgi:hypothetical protein